MLGSCGYSLATMMTRRVITTTVLAAVLAVVASCGTTVGETGPTQIEVTVGAAGVTTTAPATTEADASTTEASYRTPKALPDDAGCTPTDPQSLPPGRWFVFVYDATESSIKLDVACRFTGTQADLAASEDNRVAVDGVYIRNDSQVLVELEINNGIGIPQIDENGNDIIPASQFYPTWVGGVADGTPVWITLDPTRIRTITPVPDSADEP